MAGLFGSAGKSSKPPMETYTVNVPGGVVSRQLPAGATDAQVRGAFADAMSRVNIDSSKQAVKRPGLFGKQPGGLFAAPKAEPALKAYSPSWGEKAQQKLSDLMAGFGLERGEANRLGSRLTSFLNDWTPAGNALGVADANSQLEAQLSMLPLPGPARKVVGEAIRGIRAFHGSPHDFDRFDISKIGTGEGAQAYGHGLYFAENPAVAQQYRDDLAPLDRILTAGGREFREDRVAAPQFRRSPEDFAAHALFKTNGDIDAAIHRLGGLPMDLEAKDWLKANRGSVVPPGNPTGHLYEVNINADPNSLLDWDAPLVEQPGILSAMGRSRSTPVRDTIARADKPGQYSGELPMGGDLMRAIGMHYGGRSSPSHPKTSELLKRQGIPGLRYLDGGSRAATEGTRNYVIFDDSLIDILNKR